MINKTWVNGGVMTIPAIGETGWLPKGHHEASWEEAIEHFGGAEGSPRRSVTRRLVWFRDRLRALGVRGRLLLDGSYVSTKEAPRDFDVVVVAPPDIDALRELSPELRELLDHGKAEEQGYTVFYAPSGSKVIDLICSAWDRCKNGAQKGVLELEV